MKTADIAKMAYDAVSKAITDAVLTGALSDGAVTYDGRVVFGGERAPAGFPVATAKDKARPAYFEGFSVEAVPGWSLTANAVEYIVVSVRDILEAGAFQVCNVIRRDDMLWKSVTFERATLTDDGAGGQDEDWNTLATVQAGIIALSGAERWASDRVEAQSRWRLFVPFVTGLTEQDRVMIDGTEYAITFVNDVEQRAVWHVVDLSGGVAT